MRFIEIDVDYDMISSWWTGYSFPVVPKESLPKNGLIIEGICAGFLYCTDSNIAWLEFVVGNPVASKEVRKSGLTELLSGLTGLAKELGYDVLFSSVSHQNLMDRYLEAGFKKTDINMTNFVRVI